MILLVGETGKVGSDIKLLLESNNVPYVGISSKDLNLLNVDDIKKYLENKKFDCIINASAYTKVDLAEDEKDKCEIINHLASNEFASFCALNNAKYILYSTDYVFDGKKNGEYEINDLKNPLNEYGKSKDRAENDALKINSKTFIIRVSWVFGIKNDNFISKIIKLSKSQKELHVVSDQIGSPTYSKDIAEFTLELIKSDKYGIYHYTNSEFCSFYELAKYSLELVGSSTPIYPCDSNYFKVKAKRPLNSKLSKKSLIENGFKMPRSYKEAVKEYINELKEKDLL